MAERRGRALGTGSTYTVKTSDTGRRIRVRVTGKNGATGSVVSGWAAVQGNGTVSTFYQLKALTLNTTNAVVGTTLTATLSPSGATANIYWYLDNGTYLGYGSSYTVQPSAIAAASSPTPRAPTAPPARRPAPTRTP